MAGLAYLSPTPGAHLGQRRTSEIVAALPGISPNNHYVSRMLHDLDTICALASARRLRWLPSIKSNARAPPAPSCAQLGHWRVTSPYIKYLCRGAEKVLVKATE